LKRLWLVLLLAGCARAPDDGKQLCAPAGVPRRCFEGFICRADDHCWRVAGPGAGDGRVPGPIGNIPNVDARPFQPMPSAPGPSGYRQGAGGQSSSSEHYRVVRSVPPPPGGRWQRSEHYRMVGGLVGSTQR
jgi:hypothetical protein